MGTVFYNSVIFIEYFSLEVGFFGFRLVFFVLMFMFFVFIGHIFPSWLVQATGMVEKWF